MTPYKPSGKSRPGGTLLFVLGTLAAGLAVGAMANAIGQYFRLLILFPIGMGVAVGAVAWFFVDWGKVRAPVLVLAVALLAGLAAWTTDTFGVPYFRERAQVRAQIVER